MILPRLAYANFALRKVRTVLTLLAIAFSVALVVAVTTGYASVEAAGFKFLNQYLGTTDATVTRQGDVRLGVREGVMTDISTDPDVGHVQGRLESGSVLLDKDGQPVKGKAARLVGIRRPQDQRVDNLRIRSGQWFDGDTGDACVIDQVVAETLSLNVGDTLVLPGIDRKLSLKVAGIIHKPEFFAAQSQTIYLPLRTLQRFILPNDPPTLSRIEIDLKSGTDSGAFTQRWTERLKTSDPGLLIRLSRDKRAEVEKDLEGMRLLSYLGGTVSMLAATFIVFSALAMGVAERQRTLGMMRAIGAYRYQIGSLVMIEGVVLAVVGIAIGVPFGLGCVKALSWWYDNLFSAGVKVSAGGALFASLGSLASALVASFLPAWSAMRVAPLEAMSPLARHPRAITPIVCGIIGLVLISIDSILMFAPLQNWLPAQAGQDAVQTARIVRFYGHFVAGLPGIMLGFFLLAPAFVWIVERLLGPVVASIFGIRFSMLRQQLTGGIWRAAGTCAALMVGLAILVVMQVQGHTMIQSWKLPDKFPDVFIIAPPMAGLADDQIAKLRTVPGIRSGEVLPIGIASPGLGTGFLALAGASVMPDATMFFGFDPDLAPKMMELEFLAGNAKDAFEKLKLGRHVIVTDEFRQLKGLNIGDKIELQTSLHGKVAYTIAGIIWSPGLDVINGLFDMGGQLEQRTAASLFGSMDDARRDFGVGRINFFAANLTYFTERDEVLKQIQTSLGTMNMRAFDVRQIKSAIQGAFGKLLLLMSTVAFAAMAVSSLGVTNTIMASIRSRSWQFGILRSVGTTQGQLIRLILAEAVLLGVTGSLLGLAAGALMSINAKKLAVHVLGFDPPSYIPWGVLVAGTLIVMGITLLASLWPAINAARTEPLTLLQAGRTAA